MKASFVVSSVGRMKRVDFEGTGLQKNLTAGASVQALGEQTWRLEIPAGEKGRYRLAQLDDYGRGRRSDFSWRAPFKLALRGRASAKDIPGTWGFGLWNDPFGMAILSGAEALRLPALPNAAWFFFASAPNYLSLRDDLPAQGGLAATFRSPRWPSLLLAPGLLALPLLLLPPTARLLRRFAGRFVRQDAVQLKLDPLEWHAYTLEWRADRAIFGVDGETVLDTAVVPRGPLGLVLWVDNQYAALPPDGRLSFGSLANPAPAWIEIAGLAFGG